MTRQAARYARQLFGGIWNGLTAGLGEFGPAGILAAAGVILILMWLASGGRL